MVSCPFKRCHSFKSTAKCFWPLYYDLHWSEVTSLLLLRPFIDNIHVARFGDDATISGAI